MRFRVFSLPSRRIVSWIVSPGMYSPTRLETEPFLPTGTPLIFVIMSPSSSPARSPGPSLIIELADELLEMYAPEATGRS